MALTDRNGVYGIVRAYVKAREIGVHLITGSEIDIDDGSRIILLAQDRSGYANLCRLLSTGCLRSAKGECTVSWEEVFSHNQGLIALWGGNSGLISGHEYNAATGHNLRDAFGDRLYALITRHCDDKEVGHERRIRERAATLEIPAVASTEVLYHHPSRCSLQDILVCIRHGVTISEAGRLIKPNAEHGLRSNKGFLGFFRDAPDLVKRSEEIAERCTFSLAELSYRYPSQLLPDGMTSSVYLRLQTFTGANHRYPNEIPADVICQLNKELVLIDELDYCGYFLTMWEIVGFCRRNDIICQGRGSAANSAVCYCLGITAVDPVRMGFLFERFISRERMEPPDIDLDIEHQRREEVIQYVYDKYGRDYAAMVATVIRYRTRSAARDVGKALGLSETALDRYVKLAAQIGEPEEALKKSGFNPRLKINKHFIRLVHEIRDFPRHLSIHPGGFLLGHQPVHDLVPIENGTMSGRTVIQWDKDDIEELGLFKVDLLGLGALTQLHYSFDLLRKYYGIALSMAGIPSDDAETFSMIGKGDTVGVFQIESRAQMAMLPRMKPKNYYDLVIEVSIVRPGPIVGGMVHPYLRRRSGIEPIDYPHHLLEPVLKKTLGVPLFQEQVMRLAMIAADYTPGEADQLRRDMAAWRKSGRIERHRERLVKRMKAKGISPTFAERVFRQISGFGEYGFPESHAASFALIAYATAWLKCHYPEVFTCALLNALPMGFYSAATIVDDAKRHGVKILPVDVRFSDWDCTLEDIEDIEDIGGGVGVRPLVLSFCSQKLNTKGLTPAVPKGLTPAVPPAVPSKSFGVRMGLRYIKGVGKRHWKRIQISRETGPFASQADFVERTRLDEKSLETLAQAGAFEGFIRCRRSSLWQIYGGERGSESRLPLVEEEGSPQFDSLESFETITWDYQTTSHSTRGHPLEPLREVFTSQGLPSASEVKSLPNGVWVRYAGIAICRQSPGTASGVVFMTLEDETGFVNVILWPQIFERYKHIVKAEELVGIAGSLQSEKSVVHVVAKMLWVPKIQVKDLAIRTRDFM